MTKLKWLSARLPEPEYLATPSVGINRALGGKGLVSGRIHVLWGPKASGKTTIGLHLIKKAQQEGKICAYADAEKTFSSEWAEKCGVDLDELKYVTSNTAEDLLNLVLPDLKDGSIDVLMLDSIQSVNFESFFKPDANPMGSYARSSKMVTHKILEVLQPHQQVIFVSHAAMDLSGHYPMLKAALGNAVEHWSSTIIKVQKVNGKSAIRDSDGANLVKWRIDKSKQSKYPVEGEFYFSYDEAAIDNIDEAIMFAKDANLITGTNWLTYIDSNGEEHKLNGRDAMTEYLKENTEVYLDIVERLNEYELELVEE